MSAANFDKKFFTEFKNDGFELAPTLRIFSLYGFLGSSQNRKNL
jgi:hypothetical protein